MECAIDLPQVREDIGALDDFHGGGGSAEAIAISYFAGGKDGTDVVDAGRLTFLAQAIIINYCATGSSECTASYVFEAVARPPAMANGDGTHSRIFNNFVCAERRFQRTVGGQQLPIDGVYYCQQNSRTHVCAHASLRMALNTVGGHSAPLTSDAINKVIAHPTRAIGSTGSLAASTKRTVLRTEAPLAFAVLTTERKAA